MKIHTPFFTLEIEYLFLIILLINIFSEYFRKYIYSYFICYLFILFHELAHMLVATLFGKEIEKFKLSISGVNITIKKDYNINRNNYLKNIIIFLAGPISNIILAFLFKNNTMIYQVNIFLAIINLFPIYPLDGYNILLNTLRCLKKVNISKSNLFMEYVSNTLFLLLMFLSIYQALVLKNISILIFLLYVFVINQNRKKDKIYENTLNKLLC